MARAPLCMCLKPRKRDDYDVREQYTGVLYVCGNWSERLGDQVSGTSSLGRSLAAYTS